MPKLLLRIVSLLLVPCLLTDPLAAAAFSSPLGRGGDVAEEMRWVTRSSRYQPRFNQEAIPGRPRFSGRGVIQARTLGGLRLLFQGTQPPKLTTPVRKRSDPKKRQVVPLGQTPNRPNPFKMSDQTRKPRKPQARKPRMRTVPKNLQVAPLGPPSVRTPRAPTPKRPTKTRQVVPLVETAKPATISPCAQR